MPKNTSGGQFYAVKKGLMPGIYRNWADCEAQIKGFTGARYKKFARMEDAQSFMTGEPPSTTLVSDKPLEDFKGKKSDIGSVVGDTSSWDIVYSDGACKGNGKPGSVAGIGVWWGHNDPRNLAERCPGDQTNNRAELIAILRVLETTPTTTKPLLIRTDSQYSIQCFESWIHKWKQNSWKTAGGQDVKNAGIIRCISTHCDIRAKFGQKFRFEYVKGHSGDTGNDGADAMANQGALLPATAERNWSLIAEQLNALLNGEAVPALTLVCAHPPLVPVRVEDVNFDDYADCMLDDADLANELLDWE